MNAEEIACGALITLVAVVALLLLRLESWAVRCFAAPCRSVTMRRVPPQSRPALEAPSSEARIEPLSLSTDATFLVSIGSHERYIH